MPLNLMNSKELFHIILAIILFAFIIWFLQDSKLILPSFIIAFVVISSNIIAKKIAAIYFQTEAEISIWQFQRWGYYTRSHFKKPKPIGIILPFLLVIASMPTGFIKMLTFLQTDIKPTIKRISKKRGGLDRYSELTEWHNGWIVGVGIIINICLCFIPYILGKTDLLIEIAKYSIYYAIWNMLPIGQLDGTKIFFIGWRFYIFIWILVAIGLAFILPLII
jgi:hypothetical protein